MSIQIDAILSAHESDFCGVTRFNRVLSRMMGVPHAILDEPIGTYPLVSIKSDEVRGLSPVIACPHALFLHDYHPSLENWIQAADRVFVANPELATHVPGARVAWCPDTLGNESYPVFHTNPHILTVFTMGMAHKTQWADHQALNDWLKRQRTPYYVFVSSAFHHGRSVWGDLTDLLRGIREVYGERGVYLGFLSNAMTKSIMQASTMVAAFFGRGVRQNNTTAMAALRMGRPVITRFDQWSPYGMVPGIHALSLDDLPPYDPSLWRQVGQDAQIFMSQWYTWHGLIEVLTMDLPSAASTVGLHA